MILHRVLALAVILPAVFISVSCPAAQENLSALLKRIEPSVVTVLSYDEEWREIARGSGFFVGNRGDVITNRDLLKGADHADIKTSDGMLYPVREVVAEDREAGLIRVSVEIPLRAVHLPPLHVSFPQIGENVSAISGPPASGNRVSHGKVLAILDIPMFGKVLQVMMSLSSRFNGSPLINTEGEVIGIVLSERGQIFDIFPIERVVKLQPGRGKPFAQWGVEGEEKAQELYSSGLSYLWREDFSKAIPYFKEAVHEDPRYANAYFQIGYCNAQRTRYREAIEAYKQAIQVQPDFAIAHFYLGMAYLELKDGKSALKEYEVLKKLGRNVSDRDYASDLFDMLEK